jgi:hypothetical protein
MFQMGEAVHVAQWAEHFDVGVTVLDWRNILKVTALIRVEEIDVQVWTGMPYPEGFKLLARHGFEPDAKGVEVDPWIFFGGAA